VFLQCLLSWLSVCIDGPPLLYRLRLGSDLSSQLKQSRCTKRYPCDAGYAGIWAASTTISFFISSCSGIEYFRSDEEQGAQARFLQVRVLTGKDQGAQDQDADVRVLTGKDHGAQALAIQASCWMPLQCRLAVQCSAGSWILFKWMLGRWRLVLGSEFPIQFNRDLYSKWIFVHFWLCGISGCIHE
jgi:hypothetical protein